MQLLFLNNLFLDLFLCNNHLAFFVLLQVLFLLFLYLDQLFLKFVLLFFVFLLCFLIVFVFVLLHNKEFLYAETVGAKDIFVGVNSLDYSGYPDCRPAFVKSFELTATLGTKAVDEGWTFRINAPLQYLKKTEIIQRGLELGVDYSMTHSCYNPNPDGSPCLKCDSCSLRQKAFSELGMTDPQVQKYQK